MRHCGIRREGFGKECANDRRVHLSTGQPCRAGPKATEMGPRSAPEDPLRIVPKRFSFRVSLKGSFASFRSLTSISAESMSLFSKRIGQKSCIESKQLLNHR